MENVGLVRIETARDLVQRHEDEVRRANAVTQATVMVSKLADYLLGLRSEAILHRDRYVAPELLACRMQVEGVYDAETLAKINLIQGSDISVNYTRIKSKAAESWILDILSKTGARPWRLRPTPDPNLPEQVLQELQNRIVQHIQSESLQNPQQVQQAVDEHYEALQEALDEEAKKRAERMSEHLEDMLVEGNWDASFRAFVQDYTRYPTAILKGPVLVEHEVLVWENNQAVVRRRAINRWYRVSPWDFFPAPNSLVVGDSYLFERMILPRHELAAFRNIPGWDAQAIDAALMETPDGSQSLALQAETARAALDHRDTAIGGGYSKGSIEAWQFWDRVDGALLADWDIQAEPGQYYPIWATMVGNHIVRAAINPHPLGCLPYYCASYDPDPDSIWGNSLPKAMRNEQRMINFSARTMANNASFASGPMLQVDLDAASPDVVSQLQPLGVITYHGNDLNSPSRQPVTLFQPEMHTGEFQQLMAFFEDRADLTTGIMKYEHGNSNVGGAGDTATGLRMLLDAASKTVKHMILTLDERVIRPAVQHLFMWAAQNHPDAFSKGDCQVVPYGATEALVREQALQARRELLTAANNPIDLQIINVRNRANLWRAVCKELGLPADEIVQTDQELLQAQMEAQQQAQQAALMASAPAGAQAETSAPDSGPETGAAQ